MISTGLLLNSDARTAAQRLSALDALIAERCGAIAGSVPDWPCRAGCDDCCRSLAELPELTAGEWERLEAATAALPEATRAGIAMRVAAVMPQLQGPYVCPYLAQETGNCLVYEARPIACRTYGFYVEREKGLYCGKIRSRVETGEMEAVVWGNQTAVEAALGANRVGLRERWRG